MPPTDNTTAPTPQNPKKGFFAKLAENLFHKKSDSKTVVPPHDSQTPPPQLDDPATDAAAPATPATGAVATPAPSTPVDPAAPAAPAAPAGVPDVSAGVPSVPADQEATTVEVPGAVKTEGIDADGVNTSPSLATQPPASGLTTPEQPKEDEQTPPAAPQQ